MAKSIDTTVWLSLIAMCSLLAIQDIRSFDYWWQLQAGAYIWQTGSVPTADPFTYTVEGARWIDIHWLFQLGLNAIYSLAGHAGVVVAKLATMLGVVGLILAAAKDRPRSPLLVVPIALMAMLLATRLMPRPELPSFLCLAAICLILDRTKQSSRRWIYWIPVIQLVWVNMHGLYSLGIAVCVIHWCAEAAGGLAGRGEFSSQRLRDLSIVIGLSMAVTLINPNGYDVVLYTLQQLGMIGYTGTRDFFGAHNAELLPTFADKRAASPLRVGIFLSLATLSALTIFLNRRRAFLSDPLLWVAFLYLGVSARRNLALFAIVATLITVRNGAKYLQGRRPHFERGMAVGVGVVLFVICVDIGAGRFYSRLRQPRTIGFGIAQSRFPVGAVDWIERNRPPGPICHHMIDGGYLGWNLYPDYRPMIDGRLEIYGAERFESLFCSPPRRFQKLDRQYAFGSVLIHHSVAHWQALEKWLSQSADWELRFVDDTAAVFARASGATQERKKPVELGYPARPGNVNEDEIHLLMARVDVLSRLGEHELALAELDRAARLDPELANVSFNRAVLMIRIGDFAAATEHLERALVEDLDDPIRRYTIAGIYRNHGRDRRADALLREALELDPDLEGRLEPPTSRAGEGPSTARLLDVAARLGAPFSVLLGCGLTLALLIYQKRALGM
jgi:hypothetical protein